MSFALRRERHFHPAGALVHVVARALPGAEAAGAVLLSFALPGRRDPQRPARTSGRRGACGACAHLVRLDRLRHSLRRLPRRPDGRDPRAAGGDEGGLRGPSRRSARASSIEAASRQLLERNSFNGTVNGDHVPAGPARTARRDRRYARRDGGAQPARRLLARRAATPRPCRRAQRHPDARSVDGRRRASVDDAARAYAPASRARSRASARQASPDRRIGRDFERPALGCAVHDGERCAGARQSRPLGAPCAHRSLARPDREQPDEGSRRHRPRG